MAFRSLLILVITLLSLTTITLTYPVDPNEAFAQRIEQIVAHIKSTEPNAITNALFFKNYLSRLVDISNVHRDFRSLNSSMTDILNNASRVGELDHVSKEKLYHIQDQMRELIDRVQQISAGVYDMDLRSALLHARDKTLNRPQSDVSYNFVPPPKTDITPDLISESLAIQPQDTATVSSVIPYPDDGVMSYHVQLNGLFASTMVLNASTSIPCDTIGSSSNPNLVLLPKAIKNGTAQAVISDCLVIAVNMYRPTVINYWVQKEDGSIFSLVGDNKVRHFNQIDASIDTSLILRTATDTNTKREADVVLHDQGHNSIIQRWKIISIDCQHDCPRLNMNKIVGTDDVCGCVSSGESDGVQARGISAPDVHTATMTAEACSKMTCINNGGKPAVYNPFSRSCWCFDPVFVEVNPSGLE